MNKRKILVTGGAGFIGSIVNAMLHDAGWETLVLDNLSVGSQSSVVAGQFIQGDTGDKELLSQIFMHHSVEAVMHFAAAIDVGESTIDPAKYYRNNVANVLILLEAMKAHGVKNFIFSSSAAVYGIPQFQPITEKHPCHPINPYGETKLICEKILHDYDRAYGLRSMSLRYFNAAGGDPQGKVKNRKVKESNLIPVVLRSLLKPDGQVAIFGTDYPTADGTCIRDYIHVHDLGAAHILALQALLSGESSNIYNLGNGQGFSVKEVIHAVENVTGLTVNVIEMPRRAGDPPALVADATKARRELGWVPLYPSIEAIVTDAWKAYKV